MLSTIFPVVAGLSSGHKLGLGLVGGAFIVFALISSFVLPRRNPNFPGKHMGVYITIVVLFFVAMLSAVIIFGRESKEAAAAPLPRRRLPRRRPPPRRRPTTTTAAPAAGDPVAGKAVFASAGCGGCHTLKAASATGTIGPNLDDLKPELAIVVHQVEVGGGPMPAFKGQLSDKQISDVAAFVYKSTHP